MTTEFCRKTGCCYVCEPAVVDGLNEGDQVAKVRGLVETRGRSETQCLINIYRAHGARQNDDWRLDLGPLAQEPQDTKSVRSGHVYVQDEQVRKGEQGARGEGWLGFQVGHKLKAVADVVK